MNKISNREIERMKKDDANLHPTLDGSPLDQAEKDRHILLLEREELTKKLKSFQDLDVGDYCYCNIAADFVCLKCQIAAIT